MKKKDLKMIDEASANFREGKVSDPIRLEQPMPPPKDKVYYMETLYNGKTSEQIFQEEWAAGKYIYAGKAVTITIVREKPLLPTCCGDPENSVIRPIRKVIMVMYDIYEPSPGNCIACTWNTVKLKEWTPEEWEKEKHLYKSSLIREF